MELEKELIAKLVKIGFNKYEAMIYLTLLKNQEITAYEASKRSGVPQSKVYDTVKSLLNKNVIIKNGYNPCKYIALSLKEFLDIYKKDTKSTISYLEDNLNSINDLESINYLWHFNDTEQIKDKITSMIRNANESIYLDIWSKDYNNLYDELLDAKKRNIKIVSVLYGKVDEIGKVFYHEMDGMKEDAALNGRWLSLVIDHKECLFSIFQTDNTSYCIWTQNKPFMLVTECFITHDIFISEIYSKHKKELDEEFGPNLKSIRDNLEIG
ncbi:MULTISPECIES: TrmB family transcriptional regulator [Clostridium]|uniref:Predicted transcriptional regulator n=3 Tax=Clostridium TaxID=1485 RepID=D8GPU1_CLOLD|nr:MULTISPECIES: helix-turn-helix domain-containing protein [Clostridium]ADK14000.1 predicted transcriptional regulator [Clostridium ljungdahlii DSM 13528]AGY77230.1 TrmB family transcriptional regulator [Clostridium autoethanogenum DSM 10061]ALU37372.1 Transcriptional regulator TrmB family [Clostridium autoethanogenum DSM 10061]OAA87491.1 Sugar-specific transcriptional regulator TrmB [Clostridium ljungdahlii DSM 13528]OVY50060.1 Sugar-specific transcriptional regulator TrmB [Clostridium autoe